MREAIAICETGGSRRLNWNYSESNRKGDHVWYVSDVGKFDGPLPRLASAPRRARHLPAIYEANADDWRQGRGASGAT